MKTPGNRRRDDNPLTKKPIEAAVSWSDIAKDYAVQRPGSPLALTETPIVAKMLGNVKGQSIVDAGCAGGYYSFVLERLGASVTGVDLSQQMIKCATEEQSKRTTDVVTTRFLRGDICEATTRLGLAKASFRGGVAALLLDNVKDYGSALVELNRLLIDGSPLVVSIPHPLNTAASKVDGEWTITDYLTPREVFFHWIIGNRPVKLKAFHRPIAHYETAFLKSGFCIAEVCEPHPPSSIHPRSELDRELLKHRKKLPSIIIYKLIKESTV